MMIENLPHEKNQSIYFLMGLNEIQGGKYVERKRVELFKDVLTQNSLDAIFAKAKLLIPDWIFDLNSSSVKFGSSFIWQESGPGSHHIASNELLADWARLGAGQLQIWSSLAKFPASVLVGEGSGGQNGIILGQALTWSIEVVRALPLIPLITPG